MSIVFETIEASSGCSRQKSEYISPLVRSCACATWDSHGHTGLAQVHDLTAPDEECGAAQISQQQTSTPRGFLEVGVWRPHLQSARNSKHPRHTRRCRDLWRTWFHWRSEVFAEACVFESQKESRVGSWSLCLITKASDRFFFFAANHPDSTPSSSIKVFRSTAFSSATAPISRRRSHQSVSSSFGDMRFLAMLLWRPTTRPVLRVASLLRASSSSSMQQQDKGVSFARERAIVLLRERGVPEPMASVDWLLAHTLGSTSRAAVSTAIASGRVLDDDQRAAFDAMVQRRVLREPTQYIIGSWAFFDESIELELRAPVLVPRPETEELVDLILRDWGDKQANFVDVGSGSGAIGIALLKNLPLGSRCLAVDVNPDAVLLSSANARRNGLGDEYTARLCSALDLPSQDYFGDGGVDFIVSNPPYIPSGDMSSLDLEVSRWEDYGALDGGADGLTVAREVLNAARSLKVDRVWLELDRSHPSGLLKQELKERTASWTTSTREGGGSATLEPFEDASGHPRFAHIRLQY